MSLSKHCLIEFVLKFKILLLAETKPFSLMCMNKGGGSRVSCYFNTKLLQRNTQDTIRQGFVSSLKLYKKENLRSSLHN